MKMLFFSSDESEVKLACQAFSNAGISCEVRNGAFAEGISPQPTEAELWIQDDKDCHRALMLCVRLGVGFSKRAAMPDLDELEQVPEPAQV